MSPRDPFSHRVGVGALMLIVIVAVNVGVWWLNQFAVRRDLEPRIAELQAVRQALVEPQP